MQSGDLDQAEADRLATEAINKKEEAIQRGQTLMSEHRQQQAMSDQLQVKVEKLRQTITRYENELVTLRARARTAESTRKINQQLANVDSSSTIAMLEKMKNKVQEEESLAEAYGDIADADKSIDTEIDNVLSQPDSGKTSKSLDELKKKMGIK